MTNQHQHQHHIVKLAFLVAVAAIVISTWMLLHALREPGAYITRCDSDIYMRTAINLVEGQGLTMPRYQSSSDTLANFPSTHYPPLLSTVYAALLAVGVAPVHVPTVVSLLAWVLLLPAMGVLAVRLGASHVVAALVVMLAAFMYGFRFMFEQAMSEVIFLPLLVWLMVVLVDVPALERGKIPRLLIAVVLLALLILTRYVGVVVLGATGLWWIWWHIQQRQFRMLVGGGVLLSTSIIPFVLWLTTNATQTTQPLSSHFVPHGTFSEGLLAFLRQSVHIILPAGRTVRFLEVMGGPGLLIYLLFFLSGIFLCWHYNPKRDILKPHRTPLALFLLCYIALYTVLQPFFEFDPMTLRFMTVVLCLLLPWLFALMERVPQHWAYPWLTAYVLVNTLLTSGPIPIEDNIPRAGELAQHHPALLAWLQSLPAAEGNGGENGANGADVVVVTNEPLLFAPYPRITAEDMRTPCYQARVHAIAPWLKEGQCTSRYPAAVVIFDWDYTAEQADSLQERVEARCPDLSKQQFPHSIAYPLSPP